MGLGQKSELASPIDPLKHEFSSLVDAMRFSQRTQLLRDKVKGLEDEKKKRLLSLDRLVQDITGTIQRSKEIIGQEHSSELTKQISSFSSIAIEQTKRKIDEQSANELKEYLSAVESERTKTFKSIEAFLVTSPFPILDKAISLKFVDGAYSARAVYRCVEEVQYEFSLDTKKSPIFGREFRLSAFEKEVKLPVTLAKSWLKKEPVPDYERLDQYILSSIEATEGSMIATYSHPEREATTKIVYSRQNSHSFLTVDYFDPEMKKVAVTAEPALNRFLDSEALEKAMERIWLATLELENNKIALTKLVSGGQDVLEQLDCLDFFARSWKVISQRVMQNIASARSNKKGSSPDTENSDQLDEKFVREKIALLGESGRTVLEVLKLA